MTTFTDGQILTAAAMNALSAQAGGAAQTSNNGSDFANPATVRSNIGAGSTSSVALTMPADYSVAGSPVTTNGTIAVTAVVQSANVIKAGPASGGSAAPSYRALVTADLPAGTGTVTSVALTMPSGFSVAGSPVTNAGTLAVSRTTQGANLIEAGPASGAAAVPTYRALVAADIPAVGDSMIFQAGRFYTANGISTGISSGAGETGSLIAGQPIFVPNSIALQTLSCQTAGTVSGTAHARMVLYTDAGGVPGTPVAGTDSGDLTQTTAGVLTSGTLGVALAPGWYWPVWESSGLAGGTIWSASAARANAQMGANTATAAITQPYQIILMTHTYGAALPAWATTSEGVTPVMPLIALGF